MVQVMKIMGTSVPPTMQQATVDPHLCQRLLDTHRQVVGSLLLSPGSWCTQGPLRVWPSKSLFYPVLCKF